MQVEPKIMEHVKAILTKFGNKYIVKDNLKKNQVIEDLDHYDTALMTALLSDELIHKTYTEKVLDTEIFKLNQFIEMFEYKDFWEDSYTKYQNEIGLTVNGEYIRNNSDVILDFPFKDCVLKAGMSKEDLPSGENANEPFLNETLAAAEIDELFEPKVLVNAKKYDQNGEHPVTEFSDNDNLVIKGNNLIALHSLKDRYQGKIKLIYLDPPYNTGSDSFEYNDNFNHAAWLSFIKSRLEIAWQLLSSNGTIWISIDDNESHYLKVLADNIFGRNNFLDEIVWQRAYAPVNLKKTFSRSHDYIQVYAKNNSSNKKLNGLPKDAETLSRYKNMDNDPRGLWQSDNFSVGPAVKENIYEITTPSGRKVLPPDGYSWRFSKKRFDELLEDNRIWFGKDGNNTPRLKRFLSEVKNNVVAQTLWTYQEVGHNQESKQELKKLFNGKNVFGTPKPERLLQRILTIGSDKNDIVLDFFMGSATTQAVAMKMHRRFIGIEQMDYINTVSVSRLQKVIAGEQGGISKDVDWQGGGSFIYAELMEKNMGFLKDLQKAQTLNELNEVYNRMKQGADFDFKVDLAKFEQDRQENQRSLDEQKQTLMRMLDKNQLYYNEANLDDADVRELLSDSDYQFNKSFYQEKGEE